MIGGPMQEAGVLPSAPQGRSATLCLLLIAQAVGCGGPQGNAAEADSVAAVIKLGGKVEFDDKTPERPVVKVYLHDTAVGDADLACLEKLTKLQNLFLGRTQISDS